MLSVIGRGVLNSKKKTKVQVLTFCVTNRSTVGRWVTKVCRVVDWRCVVIAVVRAVVFSLSSLRCFFRSFRFLFLSLGGSSVAVVYSNVVGTSVVVSSSVGWGAFLHNYFFLLRFSTTYHRLLPTRVKFRYFSFSLSFLLRSYSQVSLLSYWVYLFSKKNVFFVFREHTKIAYLIFLVPFSAFNRKY